MWRIKGSLMLPPIPTTRALSVWFHTEVLLLAMAVLYIGLTLRFKLVEKIDLAGLKLSPFLPWGIALIEDGHSRIFWAFFSIIVLAWLFSTIIFVLVERVTTNPLVLAFPPFFIGLFNLAIRVMLYLFSRNLARIVFSNEIRDMELFLLPISIPLLCSISMLLQRAKRERLIKKTN